jgi:hypothetical protein
MLTTPGTFWSTSVTDSPSVASGGRDLAVTVQHVAGFPTVGPLITLTFTDLSNAPGAPNAQVFGKAAQEDHGPTDFDIARASVTLSNKNEPPAAGQVVIRASHPTGRVAFVPGYNFGWSLTNGPGRPALDYQVIPSYRGTDSAGNAFVFQGPCAVGTVAGICTSTVPKLGPNGRNSGPLPATATTTDPIDPTLTVTGRLSDYEIKAEGSPLSDTTMAFVGDVNGQLSELDLGAAASLFTDTGKIDIPAFDDTAGTPLYVAVNLTDWLSAPPSFMPSIGDDFTITSGKDSALPGFMFSTSPIDFVSGMGFDDTTPYSGEAVVRAFIDGDVALPEPSTLGVLALGGLLTVIGRHRLRQKRH